MLSLEKKNLENFPNRFINRLLKILTLVFPPLVLGLTMARVTVEDCIEKIPNRFDLVLTAAQRARNIQKGELLTIERDDDKNPVIALREIADETIDINQIEDRIIQSMQRLNESEEEITVPDEASETADEDMTNLIGLESMENFEDSGMQIGTGDELNATGFEDVDIASLDADN